MTPTIPEIRSQFPSLGTGFAFLENAGGSQVPAAVIDAVSRFYREDYAQKGATYEASKRCTAIHDACKVFMNRIFGGEATGDVAVGQSATALFAMLANAYRQTLAPGDEIVVSLANHESHIGCWERLSECGAVVKFWGVDPETGLSSIQGLREIVTERTKLICCSRTCNLLGDVLDIREVAKIARSVGAHTVVDVVASASHEAPEVEAWDIDFCCFSCYKVYGPHMAALWGRHDRWASLPAPNHRQLARSGAFNFELGCLSYESLAGFLALGGYFGFLAGVAVPDDESPSRETIKEAYRVIQGLEAEISREMWDWLGSRRGIRILGDRGALGRHPTFSFVCDSHSSLDVERQVNQNGIGIKSGHFYAWRACEAVGLAPEPGVVRVSALHYNTPDEIRRVCTVLDSVLDGKPIPIQ
ncbi:MAG: aminotransferase class V-fold PLP-dependent enzyme [Armatimonadetes bacterium]|nr:aminotransferase class V-fold PLP-dependent enzyme [Armatimonadota bacterium]MBX3107858.1 aminotransferase class V-fold PLP-dependent enzyme [Fimbriimonadaceae bacterium]